MSSLESRRRPVVNLSIYANEIVGKDKIVPLAGASYRVALVVGNVHSVTNSRFKSCCYNTLHPAPPRPCGNYPDMSSSNWKLIPLRWQDWDQPETSGASRGR